MESKEALHDTAQSDWQIIPAKKEMVSFKDWFFYFEPNVTRKNAEFIWQNSAENRDLLYADLMKEAQRFIGKMTHTKLASALDKINTFLNPKQQEPVNPSQNPPNQVG